MNNLGSPSRGLTLQHLPTMQDLNMDITEILECLAREQPAAPAMHVPGRTTLTYADLGAQIRCVRERLASWGIGRGDVEIWAAVDVDAISAGRIVVGAAGMRAAPGGVAGGGLRQRDTIAIDAAAGDAEGKGQGFRHDRRG